MVTIAFVIVRSGSSKAVLGPGGFRSFPDQDMEPIGRRDD
jgi:hypothetical protein